MAAYDLLTVVVATGKPKRIVSSDTTVDFLSIKIGSDGLEIKDTGAAFDFSGVKLSNLGAPTANTTDAATTAYVDAAVAATGTAAEWQDSVLTATVLNPSTISSPAMGDRYLIDGTGVSGWTGKDNQIAQYISGPVNTTGSWMYTVPTTGTFVSADDATTVLYYFGGSTWVTKSFEVTTASGFLSKVGNDIQLLNLAAAKIIVGNGSNNAAAVFASGDVTNDNAGVFTIAANAVTSGKINAGAVTATKLGTVTDGTTLDQSGAGSTLEIKALGVGTGQIAAAAVTAAKLGAVTDGTTLDQSGSGSTIEVKAGGVGTTQLAATSVTAAKLGSDVAGTGLTGGNGSAIAVLTTESGTNDNAGTITVRQVVYEKANGNWDLALATNSSTLGLGTRFGLVADATILTTASGNLTTLRGALVSGFTSLTIDAPVYLSRGTAGAVAQDLSSFAAGDQVIRIGFAKSASVVAFDPSFLFEY